MDEIIDEIGMDEIMDEIMDEMADEIMIDETADEMGDEIMDEMGDEMIDEGYDEFSGLDEFDAPDYFQEPEEAEGQDLSFSEDISGEMSKPDKEGAARKTRIVEISSDVVQIVAGIAASKTPGVAAMTGGGAGLAEILGRKNLAKGVRVDVKDGKAEVDVFIIAKQGTNLGSLFRELQKNVKEAVEHMTGLTVTAVNVYTQGISEEEVSAAAGED